MYTSYNNYNITFVRFHKILKIVNYYIKFIFKGKSKFYVTKFLINKQILMVS